MRAGPISMMPSKTRRFSGDKHPIGKASQYDDSYIRKAAIKYKVPYITTIAAASAAAKGISASRAGHSAAKSLQEYHSDIK